MAHMATISSKGQLVIPAALRKKYRLKAGARVSIIDGEGQFTVTPNPYEALLALRGKYAGLPLDEDLAEMRREEREREERKLKEIYEDLRS
jgi:AbrB family looped-hinge helix DNA binding protein